LRGEERGSVGDVEWEQWLAQIPAATMTAAGGMNAASMMAT
jgi:hypothetical protein